MLNTIAIHQPNYIPWLGYFYKIYQAQTFVFLDNVQYSNKGMHDYHYLKTPQGSFRIKIPVKYSFGDKIQDVLLNSQINWRENHLKQIDSNYKKTPFFSAVFADIVELMKIKTESLSELNAEIIKFICGKFGIETKFVFSSELEITYNEKNDRIIAICKSLNANVYYSGTGAAAYQNADTFSQNGVELRYSNFKPFEYNQLWGPFQSNVSIIDYLMHYGYDWQRVLDNQLINNIL